MRKIKIIGHRFGRMVVSSEAAGRRDAAGALRRYFNLRCDCGGHACVKGNDLRSGLTRSCGCLQAESRVYSNLRHGESRKSREYGIWTGMLSRCRNPNASGYSRYGGRGISVCQRWTGGDGKVTGYECFLADIGRCPSPTHSIDRIDNDGNYEPGNCRWATPKEQARHRKRAG